MKEKEQNQREKRRQERERAAIPLLAKVVPFLDICYVLPSDGKIKSINQSINQSINDFNIEKM